MSASDIFNDNDIGNIRSKFFGVTVGVVTNIKDPDKLGRCKVKLLNLDTPDYETDFVRVATPMSGTGWGMFFQPNVGDEVLVAFGNGNLDRPYIIGSLWNKNFKPPYTIDDKNDIRSIKTQTGNEIKFDDTKDSEVITVKTPKEMSVILDDKKQVITVSDKGKKNIVKINCEKGDILIQSENKINIKAGNTSLEMNGKSNKISMKSDTSIEIKSQQIVLDSSGTMDIKAGASLNIKSNGQTNVKGAIVKLN